MNRGHLNVYFPEYFGTVLYSIMVVSFLAFYHIGTDLCVFAYSSVRYCPVLLFHVLPEAVHDGQRLRAGSTLKISTSTTNWTGRLDILPTLVRLSTVVRTSIVRSRVRGSGYRFLGSSRDGSRTSARTANPPGHLLTALTPQRDQVEPINASTCPSLCERFDQFNTGGIPPIPIKLQR